MARSTAKLVLMSFALLLASGCKDEKTPAVVDPPVALDELPPPAPPKVRRLAWPGEFRDWYKQKLQDGARLPECPGGWFDKPIDDEFVLWKCPTYKGLEVKDVGQLAVHAENDEVFLITVSADYGDEKTLQETLETLEARHAESELEIPKAYRKLVKKLWDFETHVVALSAGDRGLSLLHLKSKNDLESVYALLKRQSDFGRLEKPYRLSGIEYTFKAFETQDYVGRGRERWDAKKDTDFIIIDYEVRNLTKTVHQMDPATYVIIGRGARLEPDERAERAYFASDRTGHYVMPLEYRSIRQRARVFEVPKSISSGPMILVVNHGGEKLVFELDLSER